MFKYCVLRKFIAQSVGATEYLDCITNECPDYDIKQSDDESPNLEI